MSTTNLPLSDDVLLATVIHGSLTIVDVLAHFNELDNVGLHSSDIVRNFYVLLKFSELTDVDSCVSFVKQWNNIVFGVFNRIDTSTDSWCDMCRADLFSAVRTTIVCAIVCATMRLIDVLQTDELSNSQRVRLLSFLDPAMLVRRCVTSIFVEDQNVIKMFATFQKFVTDVRAIHAAQFGIDQIPDFGYDDADTDIAVVYTVHDPWYEYDVAYDAAYSAARC
jgi:hypothetical protein